MVPLPIIGAMAVLSPTANAGFIQNQPAPVRVQISNMSTEPSVSSSAVAGPLAPVPGNGLAKFIHVPETVGSTGWLPILS